MNILLKQFLIDRHGFHCQEHSNRNNQAEYGISLEDWMNEYQDDVEVFLKRTWENASIEERKKWMIDCSNETDEAIANSQEKLKELQAELLAMK